MTVVSVTPRPPSGVSVSRSGPAGRSAYQIAVDNGFVGSVEDWLVSLVGNTGDIGPIPNHEWDGTQLRFQQIDGSWGVFVDLRGPAPEHSWSGTQLRFRQPGGAWGSYVDLQGAEGKSAYQVAVANGFVGDQSAWLASLNGKDGDDGWTPVEATVTDGDRRVKQIVDWVGGTGTKPATGKYIGATELVDDIGDAVDVRGPAGAGNGDMVASVYDPQEIEADAFDRANHSGTQDASTIDGLAAVATSGSYSDLGDKPDLGTAAALDVGTNANDVVQLDGSGKLPALDGSQLTDLVGGAWTLIASQSATDMAVLFDSIPGTYSDLLIVLDDVKHNSGSPQVLVAIMQSDAEEVAGPITITASYASSNMLTGFVLLQNVQADIFRLVSDTGTSSSPDEPLVSTTSIGVAVRLAGGIVDLYVYPSGGSLNGGTIYLYGK